MFGPTLSPIYPLKMAKIEENKKIYEQNSDIRLSKSLTPDTVALLPSKSKVGLLFALIEHFFVKTRVWSKVKGSESKSNKPYAGAAIPGI